MRRILVLNSLFYTGVILTYPGFFVFNPFANGFTVLGLMQSISTAGWIIAISLPLVDWLVKTLEASKWFLVVAVLLWPASLLVIRGFMAYLTGDPGFQYLISYPVFFVTDFVAPLLLTWWAISGNAERRKRI